MRAGVTSEFCSRLLVAAMLVTIPTCRNASPVQAPVALPPNLVAVSVHVTYCRLVGPALPITEVHAQLASGSDTLFAVTDGRGTAEFGAILPGSYRLELHRAKDSSVPSCLDGRDVNLVIPFLAGGSSLSECAALAADVTQDGTVDAADLAALRRYLVFDVSHGAHTDEWHFEGSRVLDVTHDTMFEVRGVVLGDVDLSWPGRR